jgi:hypothetical protein
LFGGVGCSRSDKLFFDLFLNCLQQFGAGRPIPEELDLGL